MALVLIMIWQYRSTLLISCITVLYELYSQLCLIGQIQYSYAENIFKECYKKPPHMHDSVNRYIVICVGGSKCHCVLYFPCCFCSIPYTTALHNCTVFAHVLYDSIQYSYAANQYNPTQTARLITCMM